MNYGENLLERHKVDTATLLPFVRRNELAAVGECDFVFVMWNVCFCFWWRKTDRICCREAFRDAVRPHAFWKIYCLFSFLFLLGENCPRCYDKHCSASKTPYWCCFRTVGNCLAQTDLLVRKPRQHHNGWWVRQMQPDQTCWWWPLVDCLTPKESRHWDTRTEDRRKTWLCSHTKIHYKVQGNYEKKRTFISIQFSALIVLG